MDDLSVFQSGFAQPDLISMMLTVLCAFLLSSLVGATYVKTFVGLSYSRNYVQAVILSAIVAATIMYAIGDSLARGLGMIGALAIIRFRTNFKDAKDILFMFGALAAGIACGVGAYAAAIVGTIAFVFTAFLLHVIPMGQASYFDGMLRFNMDNEDGAKAELEEILRSHCAKFVLITLRDMNQGRRLDYAYHVKLKHDGHRQALIESLASRIGSVKGTSLMLQEATVEL